MTELTAEFWEDWGNMKAQIEQMHQTLCGNNGLNKRVRELEIRQNWLSSISAAIGAALAYLAAYFTIK